MINFVTLDIYHKDEQSVENGSIVSETTSSFQYNGINHCFDKEATSFTTVFAEWIEDDYSDYDPEKSTDGGRYGYHYYKVIDNDPIVEFGVYYREVSVEGNLPVNEADDEAPLRFYDRIGQEQWNYPSNPYPENTLGGYDNHCDYEYLRSVFQSTDIIQYCVDFVGDIHKEITLDTDDEGNPVILIIN